MEECGGCTRKCKRDGGEEEDLSADSRLLKRMRAGDSRETELVSTNCELQDRHFHVDSSQNSSGARSDSGLSCCSDRCSSSTESCEAVNELSSKSTDLEVKSPESVTENEIETETESSTCNNFKLCTGETTPASEPCVMEPQPKSQPPSHRRRQSKAAKKPPSAEIDAFFSASEKHEHQRFAEKYNFDVVKDAPLEGRYQWVRLKH